jgi:hypothetical protein
MEASRALGYPQVDAFYSPSIGECEQKCAQRSNCNVFTYNKRSGSGACYLFTSADLKPNADFDSGTKNSALPVNPPPTTVPNSPFTVQRGMEASRALGYPQVDAFYSPSIGECEQKCAQRSNCNVFTYNKRSSGACYLYTRAELTSNPDFDSGVRNSVEQTASAQSSALGLFTIKRGVEASSAQAGETFYSQSIEDCEQKCAQQPICNVYTYKKSHFRCYLYPRADLGPNADFDSGVRN